MYLRVSSRRNKDGTAVRYLQLAHSEWDATTKTSRPKIVHNFGREEHLNRSALERLAASILRYLDDTAPPPDTTAPAPNVVELGDQHLANPPQPPSSPPKSLQ
ncbi:MAG: hypothetical protein J0I49_00995 [Pseudonocardia sp.]|uniref:hypothetical protein n=1 Tax=Pseudonocardia sp. TaxID=60912 RepID=UPI001AD19F19|nr:hypothetical protein [Pseudonocardia sp.]MBN9096685.1 hypothetical protein [Pseudonocardia sp.]